MPQIAVVGSGITGVTTAYALAEKGYTVTVFDRHRYPAMETSYANGGQLSASNAEVWNLWSTVLKGLKWMLMADAPVLMNPSPSWHKYSWLAEFVTSMTSYRTNTVETAKLAIEARRRLYELAARENIDFDHETRGILHFYREKRSFDHALEVNALLNQGGLDRRVVTPSEINAIEPALTGNYYGGFFTPSDSSGDIHKFTCGLAEACKRRGVDFLQEMAVEDISTTGACVDIKWRFPLNTAGDDADRVRRFDGVVICAGVASRAFAAKLGDRVNIYPVKGYSITVELNDETSQAAAPWVSLLDDETKIVASRLGRNRFRVAGTAEFNGENKDIRADRIKPLVDWTRQLFPSVNTSTIIPWAGLRPMMPNMMPRVGVGRHPGVFYNTGHGHLGWTLSHATAEAIAEVIAKKLPV